MTHRGGVDSLGIVVNHSGQAEVGHFTYEIAVDEDVPRRQIAMDVAHVGEVPHPCRDAAQHSHQLDDGELTVVLLREKMNTIDYASRPRIRRNGCNEQNRTDIVFADQIV